MMRYGPRWAGPLRAAVVVSLLAAAAVTALFLAGVLSPGASAETGSFSVNGKVTKIRIDYSEPCGPVRLATTIDTSSISGGNPKVIVLVHPTAIATPGDVAGCLATDASPGFLRIDDELFGYSAIAAKTTESTGTGTGTPISVTDLADQEDDWPLAFPSSGQAYIGTELVSYTKSESDTAITLTQRGLNGTSIEDHDPGSLLRLQGKLKLVARQQLTYRGQPTPTLPPPPTPTPTVPSHDWPAQVRSPVIQLTCRVRLEQTTQSGLDPVTARTRCYAVLAPGAIWLDGPVPDGALLPLTPIFFHELSTGTINDKGGEQTLTLTTDYLGIQCFPYIEGWLWTKITTAIDLDTLFVVDDVDDGRFRITLYSNSACTSQLPTSFILPLGQNDILPGATPTPGNNLRSTQGDIGTTDTDGDGCPDYRELGDRQGAGGLRDPFNPYDYLNAENDGTNLSGDILVIVKHYRHNQSGVGLPHDGVGGRPYHAEHVAYQAKLDTTSLGPGGWNLGPGNGSILSEDILNQVKQYRHNCGTGIVKPTNTPGAQTPTPLP